ATAATAAVAAAAGRATICKHMKRNGHDELGEMPEACSEGSGHKEAPLLYTRRLYLHTTAAALLKV
ncbi:unnamed protein product, partial [Ceratitis capitata]